jgi:peptidyl-tRNA hydrolase
MSKGKIAAQVSHVAMLLVDQEKTLGRAIVLKSDHDYFNMLCQISGIVFIQDAGLTEVLPGTKTCLGFVQTEETKKLTKSLKLL